MKGYNFIISLLITLTVCVSVAVSSDSDNSNRQSNDEDTIMSKVINMTSDDHSRQARYNPFEGLGHIHNLTASYNLTASNSLSVDVESGNNNNNNSSESHESLEYSIEAREPQITIRHVGSGLKGGPRGNVDQPMSYQLFEDSFKENKDTTDPSTTEQPKQNEVKHVYSEYRPHISHMKSSSEKDKHRTTPLSKTSSDIYNSATMSPSASETQKTQADAEEEASTESSRESNESTDSPEVSSGQGDPSGTVQQSQFPPSSQLGTRPHPTLQSNPHDRPESPINTQHSQEQPPPIRPFIGPVGPPRYPGPMGLPLRSPTVGAGPVFPQGPTPGHPPFPLGPAPVGQGGFRPVSFQPSPPNEAHFEGNHIGQGRIFGLAMPRFRGSPFSASFHSGKNFNHHQFNANGIGDLGSPFNFGSLPNGSFGHSIGNMGLTGHGFDGTFNGLFGSSENEFDGFENHIGNPFLGGGFGPGFPNPGENVNFNQGGIPNGGFRPPKLHGFNSQNSAGMFRPSNIEGHSGELAGNPASLGFSAGGGLTMNTLESGGGPAPMPLRHSGAHMTPVITSNPVANIPTQGKPPYHIIPGGNYHMGGAKSSATDLHFALRPHKIPPCAAAARGNMTYCTTDDNYPRESIVRSAFLDPLTARRLVPSTDIEEELAFAESNSIATRSLQTISQGRGIFRLDLNGIHKLSFLNDPMRQKMKINSGLSEACSSEIRTVQPLRAKNTRGAWKVIVNVATPQNGQKYTQYVRIEACKNTGAECDQLNMKQRSQCVQKETTRRLAAWSPEEGLHVDTFLFPVACSCLVA